ncbi:MAG: hypothetical protein M3443_18325 [Actinomycetota bacterium]|nr:hypothetical protein [Actinomycetota bacterium]
MTNLGSSSEIEGTDTTTSVSLYDLLIPTGYPPLTPATKVVDAAGALYHVEGKPAPRRGYQAAALRWVSDRQET